MISQNHKKINHNEKQIKQFKEKKYVDRQIKNSCLFQFIDSIKPKEVLSILIKESDYNIKNLFYDFPAVIYQKHQNDDLMIFVPDVFKNEAHKMLFHLNSSEKQKYHTKLITIDYNIKFLELALKTSAGFAGKNGHWNNNIKEKNLDYYYNPRYGYTMLPKSRVKNASTKVPDQNTLYGSEYGCGPNTGLRSLWLLDQPYYGSYESFVRNCPRLTEFFTETAGDATDAACQFGKIFLTMINPFNYKNGGVKIKYNKIANTTVGPKPKQLASYLTKKLKDNGRACFQGSKTQGRYEEYIVKYIVERNYPTIILLSSSLISMHYVNIIGVKRSSGGKYGDRFVIMDTDGRIGDISDKDLEYWLEGYKILGLYNYNVIEYNNVDADCDPDYYGYDKIYFDKATKNKFLDFIKNDNATELKWLIAKYKIDLDKEINKNHETYLMYAAEKGALKVAELFYGLDADNDKININRERAIDIAYKNNRKEMVEWFVNRHYMKVLPSLLKKNKKWWYKEPSQKLEIDYYNIEILKNKIKNNDYNFENIISDYKMIDDIDFWELFEETAKFDNVRILKILINKAIIDNKIKEKEEREKEESDKIIREMLMNYHLEKNKKEKPFIYTKPFSQKYFNNISEKINPFNIKEFEFEHQHDFTLKQSFDIKNKLDYFIDIAYEKNSQKIILYLIKEYNLRVEEGILDKLGRRYWYPYKTKKEIEAEKRRKAILERRRIEEMASESESSSDEESEDEDEIIEEMSCFMKFLNRITFNFFK